MIYELLVTSVKRALQAGRSGFAPVMRTRGMHPDLQSRLEALSGYRHDFTQGDPRNSVLLSHSVIESTAGKFSVLSRIVDAGSDHSGRSNKLAHHLSLDGSEIRSATGSSPAVTLMGLERSGTFATQWNSEPNEKNPGQSISFPPTEPAQCRDWERYAGDAGWAGVLIDRALRGQPTWIICGRGTHILPLFAEALALVEPARRWGISFTTHAITTTGFLWMVALDGSPEAQIARAQNRIPVIDTTRPCTTPTLRPPEASRMCRGSRERFLLGRHRSASHPRQWCPRRVSRLRSQRHPKQLPARPFHVCVPLRPGWYCRRR